jgi:hypothetical protein
MTCRSAQSFREGCPYHSVTRRLLRPLAGRTRNDMMGRVGKPALRKIPLYPPLKKGDLRKGKSGEETSPLHCVVTDAVNLKCIALSMTCAEKGAQLCALHYYLPSRERNKFPAAPLAQSIL